MITLAAKADVGIRAEIDVSGRVRIFLQDLLVAEGDLTVADGADDFKQTTGPLGKLTATEVSRESAARSKITRKFENATAELTLDLAGEDLTITIVLQNRHAFGGPTLRFVKLTGLTLPFARPADGSLGHWHISYLRHYGPAIMHPSVQAQIGAWTAADDAHGIGIHVPSHTHRRKFAHADYDHAHQDKIPPTARLSVYADEETPPQSASQIIVSLRFSRNTDTKHLLTPYRAEVSGEPLAYQPDQRVVVQFASVDKTHITPMNPFGFHGDARRLDTIDGVDKFLKMVADPLAKAGGLGCILWAPQGVHPRGAMYRPDFDIFPPAIDRLIPALIKGFQSRGLRLGLCTRPGEVIDPTSSTRDDTLRITGGWQPGIDRTIARFKAAVARGFDLFYLDSFGNSYDDYLIMRQLRAALGPKVLCWAEHACDIFLPLCGRYAEWGKTDMVLHSHAIAETFHWLFPDAPYLVFDREPNARPPLTANDYGSHRYTPLIQDYATTHFTPLIQEFQLKYLANGQWRPASSTQPSP